MRIKPIGVAEGDGAGTTAYSTDGIVEYTPTQAETNYTSFILIAKKTGCVPVSVTVITTKSATAGTVNVSAINDIAASSVTTINANIGTTQPTNFSGTGSSAYVKSDVEQWLAGTIPAVNVTGVPKVDAAYLLGTAWLTPGTAGTPDVNVKLAGGTAWASGAITSSVLATDCITSTQWAASATTEVQSGLATSSALSAVAAQLPAALTSNGNLKVSLQEILTTAITEGATGRIAAAWQGMFNVASPVFTAQSVNQTGDNYARIGATGSGLTSLAPSSTALSTAQWTNSLATNLGTLAGHDPGATLGTSTLTQAQVTGGAYALNSASFAWNSALDFTTTEKTSLNNATPVCSLGTDAIGSTQLAASAVSEIWAGVTDSSGVTTLLSRLSATRAGYLDNLSGGAVALASAVAALNNISSANVLTQVETALATTTRAMAGQGTPSATPTLSEAMMLLYKLATNPITEDATTQKVYNRAGSTVDHKRPITDDGTTFTNGALVTGP